MKDNEGTKWDVFGNGISGPREGTKLKPLSLYTAYLFAWAAFHPGEEIHGMPSGTFVIAQMQEISWNGRLNLQQTERELSRDDVKRRILKEWPLILIMAIDLYLLITWKLFLNNLIWGES